MDSLDITLAKLTTLNLIDAMKLSIEELKKSPKTDKAKPYITGMTKHIEDLQNTFIVICNLDEGMRLGYRNYYSLHRQNTELRFEIDKLKSEIKNIMELL